MVLVISMGPSLYREIDSDVEAGGLDEIAPRLRRSQLVVNES